MAITDVVEYCLGHCEVLGGHLLENILASDQEARRRAADFIGEKFR